MVTVYAYEKCSTCKDALKWLKERGIAYEVRAIRETPPTVDELKLAMTAMGGDLRRIFNTSGVDYRAMSMKDKLPTMSEEEALVLLSTHGNLVKRPMAFWAGEALVGFKAPDWAKALE